MSRSTSLQLFDEGSPHGEEYLLLDDLETLVTLGLLVVFREDIVGVVAAANVSYLVVFLLLPAAYLVIRRRERPASGTRTLPRSMNAVARGALVLNATLLVVGGLQWGVTVVVVGIALMIAGMPFYVHRQRGVQDVETVA